MMPRYFSLTFFFLEFLQFQFLSFKFLIHFELFYVYGVFHSLHVDI